MTKIRIRLEPVGADAQCASGAPLADALVAHGVEFPCGGRGRCRGCRVRIQEGTLAETPADLEKLSAEERKAGWRLACQARPTADLKIELRQWAGLVLADETPFAFTPADGLGIAVDIGTTTVVAQLLDLSTGRVLGTRTALNPQARYGADVMSRIGAACSGKADELKKVIRDQIAAMVQGLLSAASGDTRPVVSATLVGNTAMHHLYIGHDANPLGRYPFEPVHPEAARFAGSAVGWTGRAADAVVVFLPVLGGFVGSDILGVLLATGLAAPGGPGAAADLGTNGELMVRNGPDILVASTAAGPAFEGARIAQGMRASEGAIDRVTLANGKLDVHVLGGVAARGVCGSGLVDAVACALDLGTIAPSGRLSGESLQLADGIGLTQTDIRELQLAKGAIAAGLRILFEAANCHPWPGGPFWLAGAFGNSLDPASARRIGLLPFEPSQVRAAGNAALLGAKMALGLPNAGEAEISGILNRVRHVPLEARQDFQELFAESMTFPEPEGVIA